MNHFLSSPLSAFTFLLAGCHQSINPSSRPPNVLHTPHLTPPPLPFIKLLSPPLTHLCRNSSAPAQPMTTATPPSPSNSGWRVLGWSGLLTAAGTEGCAVGAKTLPSAVARACPQTAQIAVFGVARRKSLMWEWQRKQRLHHQHHQQHQQQQLQRQQQNNNKYNVDGRDLNPLFFAPSTLRPTSSPHPLDRR